jgi:hypothetical protein
VRDASVNFIFCWRSTIIGYSYATNLSIKQFQNLLWTSLEEPERKTIQKLFAAEKPEAVLQALELRRKASHHRCC